MYFKTNDKSVTGGVLGGGTDLTPELDWLLILFHPDF